MSEITFDCQQAFDLLDDFLDRELSELEMAAVQAHLEACAHCAECFDFEASFLRCVRSKMERLDVPSDLKSRIFEALQSECRG